MPRLSSTHARSLIGASALVSPPPTGPLIIADAVSGNFANYTNMPTISTAIKKFGPGSIDMPYALPASEFELAGTTIGMTITVEMWHYIDVTPGTFDVLFEVNGGDSSNYILTGKNGTINGPGWAISSPRWTPGLNTWEHYVVTLNLSTRAYSSALNGVRRFAYTWPSSYTYTVAPIKLSFNSTPYNGLANGYIDEIRVSTGDTYNLLTNNAYTVPTAPLTVTANTLHLFKVQ